MFQVKRETGPFGECQLIDTGSDAVVRIAPARGGIANGFSVAGREIFYLDSDTFLDPAKSVRGGMPILFPICSGLTDETYTVEGQPYTLKQHGLARILEWQVIEESTVGGAAVTLQLVSTPATRERYPFDFELRFTYLLQDNELTVRQEYFNHDQQGRSMPMYAGLHPYFPCSDKPRLQLVLPATEYVDNNTGATGHLRDGLPFDAPSIDWMFTDVRGQEASVTSPADGYRISLRYDTTFPFLVFWTLKDRPFYCLEPWMAPRNAMNTGDHLQQVPAGDRLVAEVSILGEVL